MVSESTVSLLFWPITAGRSLQCVDTHYRTEERTSSFWPHTDNALSQTVQNLNVKYGIHCLTFRYIFVVINTFAVKNKISIVSMPLIFEIEIFWRAACSTALFGTLALCFQIICKTPTLVTSNYRVQKVWVTFDHFNKVVSVIKHCSFCLAVNVCGTNHAQSFHFCKSSCKICCTIVFGVPIHSAMSVHEDRLSFFKISAARAMFSCILVIVGLLLTCSSQIDSRPSENVLYQWNTVAQCTVNSP